MAEIRFVGCVVVFSPQLFLTTIVDKDLNSFYDKLGRTFIVKETKNETAVRKTAFIEHKTEGTDTNDFQASEWISPGPGMDTSYVAALSYEMSRILGTSIGTFYTLIKHKINGITVASLICGIYCVRGFGDVKSQIDTIAISNLDKVDLSSQSDVARVMSTNQIINSNRAYVTSLNFSGEPISAFDMNMMSSIVSYIKAKVNGNVITDYNNERMLSNIRISAFLNRKGSEVESKVGVNETANKPETSQNEIKPPEVEPTANKIDHPTTVTGEDKADLSKSIGIIGHIGVGKTTMAEKLHPYIIDIDAIIKPEDSNKVNDILSTDKSDTEKSKEVDEYWKKIMPVRKDEWLKSLSPSDRKWIDYGSIIIAHAASQLRGLGLKPTAAIRITEERIEFYKDKVNNDPKSSEGRKKFMDMSYNDIKKVAKSERIPLFESDTIEGNAIKLMSLLFEKDFDQLPDDVKSKISKGWKSSQGEGQSPVHASINSDKAHSSSRRKNNSKKRYDSTLVARK